MTFIGQKISYFIPLFAIICLTFFTNILLAQTDEIHDRVEQTDQSWLSKIEKYLPDTVGYSARYSILGFAVASGGSVQRIVPLHKISPLLINWSFYRSRELTKVAPWTFDYRFSPMVSSYYLNQEYSFILKSPGDANVYFSKYQIKLLRVQAIGSFMGVATI